MREKVIQTVLVQLYETQTLFREIHPYHPYQRKGEIDGQQKTFVQ